MLLAKLAPALAAVIVSGGASGGQPLADAPREVHCVVARPEVRYGNLGYDHIVHLTSQCTVPVRCAVSTDVNPKPVEVDLAPHAQQPVITFRGSPSRVFTPHVSCRAHG